MKKEWSPAHTEYFLTLERGAERLEYYNGSCYRKKAHAQRDADRMNAHRKANTGRVVVESKEREGGWSYITTLRFG